MSVEIEVGSDNVELYPPWREALEKFVQHGFGYGDTVSKEWLEHAFGMKPIAGNEVCTYDQFKERAFLFMNNLEPMKEALRTDYQMDLVATFRESYLIIQPKDQAARAMRDMQKRIAREIKKALSRVQNVNTGMLTSEERQQYIDALTKVMNTAYNNGLKRQSLLEEDTED